MQSRGNRYILCPIVIFEVFLKKRKKHYTSKLKVKENTKLCFSMTDQPSYTSTILECSGKEMISKLATNQTVKKLTHEFSFYQLCNINIKYLHSTVSFHHRHTCSRRSNMDAMNYRRIEKLSCNINRIPFIYNIPTLFLFQLIKLFSLKYFSTHTNTIFLTYTITWK